MSESIDIPASWLHLALGEIIDYGKTIKVEPSEIPPDAWVLELEDVEKDTSKLSQRLSFAQRQSKSTKNRFTVGDVLYGKLRPYLNKVIVADRDGYCSTEIIPLKPNQAINGRFLFYWLKHSEFLSYAESASHGLNMPRLGTEAGQQAPLVLAPLEEQKRIAGKLDTLLTRVDACRDRLDRMPRILKKFRQSVINAATSGELTKDWVYSSNPEVWQEALIGDFLVEKPRNGYSPRAVEFETETRSLTLTATSSGRFKPAYLKYINEIIPEDSHLWLEPDDILIQRANTLEYVGVSAIYDGPSKGYIYPDLMMKCRANSRVLTKFLYYLLSSDDVRSYFRESATGTTGSMPKINQRTVISAPVAVPPIDEQQEIVYRVEALLAYADRLEDRYQNAFRLVEQITSALLSTAFRGELVPPDPNSEPASVLLERIQAERLRMKSEQKTTRTVRHTTKEEPKAPTQPSLDDYIEALRSAFEQLGGKVAARQLFDQAGFKPEEAVQFYEALRAIPEVRAAFKNAVQEQLPQKQSSVAKIPDNSLPENGHFRLVELWLEDFKNLTDYTVHFDPSHTIGIVLGWNGTGKSNLFEALVIICIRTEGKGKS